MSPGGHGLLTLAPQPLPWSPVTPAPLLRLTQVGEQISIALQNLGEPLKLALRSYHFVNGVIRQTDRIATELRRVSVNPAKIAVDLTVDVNDIIGWSVLLDVGLYVAGYLADNTFPSFAGAENIFDLVGIDLDGLKDVKTVWSNSSELSNISFEAKGRRGGVSGRRDVFSGVVLNDSVKVSYSLNCTNTGEVSLTSQSANLLILEPETCPIVPHLSLTY